MGRDNPWITRVQNLGFLKVNFFEPEKFGKCVGRGSPGPWVRVSGRVLGEDVESRIAFFFGSDYTVSITRLFNLTSGKTLRYARLGHLTGLRGIRGDSWSSLQVEQTGFLLPVARIALSIHMCSVFGASHSDLTLTLPGQFSPRHGP